MALRSINSFVLLGRDLRDRLTSPVGSFTFWTFVLFGVVMFGGLAIWIEIVKYSFGLAGTVSGEGIRTAVNTYFPAVGCAAAQQILIAEKQRMYLRSFGYAASITLSIFCIFAFLLQVWHPYLSLAFGIGCSAVAVIVWWIANGADPTFHDTAPDAAVGGPTAGGLAGNTTGFTV
jgi:hypothetical protein